ncbi:hypothetical protein C8F04DRAFT_1184369 [Mycena alexandri]|uniref:Uncharacterized protein n=1 Tax=Mycena alexandri TaxID=1745969 RepID=A0AAD6SVD3_9AGAR|nr:hypothetical protein C8F04DRAFT_1184369 [Mycena alexandri]
MSRRTVGPECQRQSRVPGDVPRNGWRKADETECPKAAGGCSEGVTEVAEKRRSAPKSRTVVREKNGCVKESELGELPDGDAERPEVEFVEYSDSHRSTMLNDGGSPREPGAWTIAPKATRSDGRNRGSGSSTGGTRSDQATDSVCSDVWGLIRSERSFGAEHRSSENRTNDWLNSGEQSVQDHPRVRLLARCTTPERAPGSGSERSERSIGAREGARSG